MMHWHLVYTKPRQEECALKNLQQQGFECYLPVFPAEKICKKNLAIAHVPLFPRYIFVRLGAAGAGRGWGVIRSTRGVSRLVVFGNEPARVDEGLIEFLRTQESAILSRPQRMFAAGDRIRVTEGPFAGIEGIYEMANGESRVMVLIEFMSKPVRMGISPGSLRKVE